MAARAAQLISHITVPAVARHTATVIFVHGLGDSGHGWEPVADMFSQIQNLQHIKWVLPHAPERPVTANMGMIMPSWFDIKAFGSEEAQDEDGMMETVDELTKLIDAEIDSGIQPNRIVLGGFSQGCAMSLLTGLTTNRFKLAGIAALSGRVPLRYKFKELISSHATSIPVFWGHGSSDPLIRIEQAEASVDLLKSLGFNITNGVQEAKDLSFNVYPGLVHSTSPKELDDLKTWLSKALPNEGGL